MDKNVENVKQFCNYYKSLDMQRHLYYSKSLKTSKNLSFTSFAAKYRMSSFIFSATDLRVAPDFLGT